MQISRVRKIYFHENHVSQPLVDLVIADIPEGLPVPRLCDHDHVIPFWNAKNVDSMQSIFSFCNKYLHDDGALLVFQPFESRKLLMPYLKGLSQNSLLWICYNGMILTHPILPNQKIIYSLSHLQSYFFFIIFISYHT